MKIVLLFAGRVGLSHTTYDNIMQNVVGTNTCDVFLSHDPTLNESVVRFIELYNPVSINNEHIPLDEFITTMPDSDIAWAKRRVQCQFYNKKRVLQVMQKHGREYDVVVMYRSDVITHTPIDFSKFVFDDKTVFIPNGCDYYGINDQIAFGSMKAMEVYMSLYDSMKTYYMQGIRFLGEPMLKQHIDVNCLSVVRFDFDYFILRPDRWNELRYDAYTTS